MTFFFGGPIGLNSQSQFRAPIGIGADVLAAWAQTRSGGAAAFAGPALAPPRPPITLETTPPPWDGRSRSVSDDALVRRTLADGKFIDKSLGEFGKIGAVEDHKKLFAAHEALRRLTLIAEEASGKTVSDARRNQLQTRFAEGLDQVRGFFAETTLDNLSMVAGLQRTSATANAGVPRGLETYRTGQVYAGDPALEVPAWAGDVAFEISVQRPSGPPVAIDIDLADMGATPRTLDAVVAHINGSLETAGFSTRFAKVELGEPDENGILNSDRWALEVRGLSTEKLSFSAADAEPVARLVTTSGGGTSELAPRAGHAMMRIDGIDGAAPVRAGSVVTLAAEESETTDTALTVAEARGGPDGATYVLGTTTGNVEGGPDIRGVRDVVLAKYDAAGKMMWSRVLGAEDAEGLSLSVNASGEVAVAGKVTGAFGDTIDRGGGDAFVSVYDAAGDEAWTQRFGGLGEDAASAVALADDGTVYVAGQTRAALEAGGALGQADGFVRAFGPDGATEWTRQFGTAGADRATALTLGPGGEIYVAGQEDGAAVVRRFEADGTAAAGWPVALGGLDTGGVTAIAADASGVYVAGSAGQGASLGGLVNAHGGGTGRDAFVAVIDPAAPGGPAVDRSTFLGSAFEDNAADLTLADGKVFVTGSTAADLATGTSLDGGRQTFLARLDAASLGNDWTTQVSTVGGRTTAAGVVVDPGHSRTLEAFGMPRGELALSDARTVEARTAARPGDFFSLRIDGGRPVKIELKDNASMRALAFEVDRVLGRAGDASVTRANGADVLRIAPKPGVRIELIGGDAGRDLLGALGLGAGVVERPAASRPGDPPAPKAYALGLGQTLSLRDAKAAEAAKRELDGAMATIRRAYRELTTPPEPDETPRGRNANGRAPEFLTAQLANYQAALQRLGGF